MTLTQEKKQPSAAELAACQKLLRGTGLTMRQAIALGLRNRALPSDKTIGEILEVFLRNRQTIRNNRQRTIDEYRCQLGRFARDFSHRPISDITPTEIETWLAAPHLDYKNRRRTWAASRRNVTRGYIATLFTFGITKKLCTTNPAAGVDKAIVDRPPIEVWTPEETILILNVATRDCPEVLPFLLLSLFSGVRTCELLRLLWEHVKLEQAMITIPALISKTRRIRNVPMSDNLAAWLASPCVNRDSDRLWPLGESSLHRRYRIMNRGPD